MFACFFFQLASSTVNKRADNGATPVYFAAQEGRLNCLQFLIQQVRSGAGEHWQSGAGEHWQSVNGKHAMVIVNADSELAPLLQLSV